MVNSKGKGPAAKSEKAAPGAAVKPKTKLRRSVDSVIDAVKVLLSGSVLDRRRQVYVGVQ